MTKIHNDFPFIDSRWFDQKLRDSKNVNEIIANIQSKLSEVEATYYMWITACQYFFNR